MLVFSIMMVTLLSFTMFGVPIALSMGASSFVVLGFLRGFSDIPWDMLAQRLLYGVNNFMLLAIPFFLLAGRLANELKVTDRIFAFAKALVGHLRGGVGHVCVVASMIFAGMSGSGVAEAGGLGLLEIKAMTDDGYDKDFATALAGAAATIGPIIPPSIPLVLYGAVANASVAALLIGGVFPGVIMGLMLMFYLAMWARRHDVGRSARATFRQLLRGLRHAVFPLLTPVILVGGILTGVFTPTEAAAVCVVYLLFLGTIYRTISARVLLRVLRETMVDTSNLLLIIAASSVYSWIIARYQLTLSLTEAVQDSISSPTLFLILANILFLIVGCFIDTTPAIFIFTPVILPLVEHFGIDVVHFGVMMVLNLVIGLITPLSATSFMS